CHHSPRDDLVCALRDHGGPEHPPESLGVAVRDYLLGSLRRRVLRRAPVWRHGPATGLHRRLGVGLVPVVAWRRRPSRAGGQPAGVAAGGARTRGAHRRAGVMHEMRSVQRIAILGAESSGKSTLAAALAEHYNTVWVPEFLREFVDTHQRVPREEDQYGIGRT